MSNLISRLSHGLVCPHWRKRPLYKDLKGKEGSNFSCKNAFLSLFNFKVFKLNDKSSYISFGTRFGSEPKKPQTIIRRAGEFL